MRIRLSITSGFLLLVLAYMASPYVALWQLEGALDRGDIQALERGVDWKSIREGLKQDMSEGIIGPVQTQMAANGLPPFGASFISGIADTEIERDVSPANIVAIMRQMRETETKPGPFSSFQWAFFDSPTVFTVLVRTSDDDADGSHLRLRLAMKNGRWTLMRAWIPQDLIEKAGQRT